MARALREFHQTGSPTWDFPVWFQISKDGGRRHCPQLLGSHYPSNQSRVAHAPETTSKQAQQIHRTSADAREHHYSNFKPTRKKRHRNITFKKAGTLPLNGFSRKTQLARAKKNCHAYFLTYFQRDSSKSKLSEEINKIQTFSDLHTQNISLFHFWNFLGALPMQLQNLQTENNLINITVTLS